jgi:hypothetical protein
VRATPRCHGCSETDINKNTMGSNGMAWQDDIQVEVAKKGMQL